MNALDQAWGVLKSIYSDDSDEHLVALLVAIPVDDFRHPMIMEEIEQRLRFGTDRERSNLIALMEKAANKKMQEMGKEPVITNPPQEYADMGLDFPENFDREKLASADAFTSAWDVVKAVLPDLAFNTELERFKGYNPYERDALTYQLSIDPEDARKIVDSKYGYMRDEDSLKYPTQMDAWKRELAQNPTLFQYPQHIMSRLSGRHSRDQSMSMEDFRNFALNTDYPTQENIMTRYIDEMERRGAPVVVGNAQITPATQNMHTITLNPGFEGQGFGRHLLGAMIQEQGGVNDNQFSREGYNLFRNMGNLLTQGGEQSIVPFIESGAEVDDFAQKYYTNRGLVDSILGDVRFTQPYGQDLSDGGDGYYYMSDGELVYNPPPFYPIEFSKPRGRGINPNVKGRNPFEIVYTGDDPAFITNLGVD